MKPAVAAGIRSGIFCLSLLGCGTDGGARGGTGGIGGSSGAGGTSASGGIGGGGASGASGSGGTSSGGTSSGGTSSGGTGAGGTSAGGASGSSGTGGSGGCIAPLLPPPKSGGLEIGGSSYVMWDVSAYLADETKWYAPLALKPVIGTYHLSPTTVGAQLVDMAQHGQKQISLMLWYMPIDAGTDGDGDGVYGHVIDSSLAKLLPQHRDNLVALLANIRCAGFGKLYFRFAPQGKADASGWTAWDEAQFQENWNFIHDTRKLVDSEMSGSGVSIIYDLSVELGGITTGQAKAYTKKLWQNFDFVFGTQQTYGFSFATAPGRLTSMIGTYDETGSRPPMYAFDIYGDEANVLGYLAKELAAAGDSAKPIIVQETYYNDPTANAGFRSSAAALGLKLTSIFQWPLDRGATIQHFSMNYPADYAAYLVP